MTHAEFVAAYARGELTAELDPKAAGRFMSDRLLLPFVQMPVLGIGVALALTDDVFPGLAVVALGIVVPRLIKRSAPRFLLQNALEDKRAYEELTRANVLRITPSDDA